MTTTRMVRGYMASCTSNKHGFSIKTYDYGHVDEDVSKHVNGQLQIADVSVC